MSCVKTPLRTIIDVDVGVQIEVKLFVNCFVEIMKLKKKKMLNNN